MENDIRLALEQWEEINSYETRWASLEIIQEPFRAVRLHIGNRHLFSDGWRKECRLKTRHFHLIPSGEVVIFDSYFL